MENRTARMAICIIMLVMLISHAYAQSYTTYAESSNLGKKPIEKTSIIWILSDTTSFMWNRTLESSVGEKLTKKGIKVFQTTDYIDVCDLEENDYPIIASLILESDSDFMLTLELKELYTYSIGGGVVSMDVIATLFDYKTSNNLLKIELSTESDKNDYMSLNASRGPAVDSMADMLTKEFMKYVK